MSRFFSEKYKDLVPYTPGEQPKDRKFIKLNTNESPFPPAPGVAEAAAGAAASLQLYSDPTLSALRREMAKTYGLTPAEVILTNGSDEVLNFAFMAYCDDAHPAVFPDITYGFYRVFADLYRIPYTEVPLREDFSVDLAAMKRAAGTVFLANPNAPTGLSLPLADIEALVASDPHRVVVIDEAYVDFGGESALPLIRKYDNLLVTGTFSKSRSLAGGRLGFGFASPALIADLDALRYSTNPYNVNSMTAAAGLATLAAPAYTAKCTETVCENRAFAVAEMKKLGFDLTDSKANFLFARHDKIGGAALFAALRERGILVRHFTAPRIADYNRITVGSRADMTALVAALADILKNL